MLINGDAVEELKKLPTSSVDAAFFDPPYQFTEHKIDKTSFSIEEVLTELKRVVKHNGFIAYYGMQPTLTDWNYISNRLFVYVQEFINYKRIGTNFLNSVIRQHENLMLYRNAKNPKDKKSRKINTVYRNYTDVKESLSDYTEASTMIRTVQELKRSYDSNPILEDLLKKLKGELTIFTEKPSKRNDNVVVRSKLNKMNRNVSSLQSVLIGLKPRSVVSFTPHNLTSFSSAKKENEEFNVKHPTVKSILEAEYFLSMISDEGDTIIDPFMGSGTTGIACIRLNRNFIGIELFEEYYIMSKNRIEKENQEKKNQEKERD